jgi:hypothetical protein
VNENPKWLLNTNPPNTNLPSNPKDELIREAKVRGAAKKAALRGPNPKEPSR